ncbi:Lrp/AsnC family transcriptional regulator [Candidatus Woesearchaeota archaeon]|nr:Lrp/AsnC family transcriptional regulator [Candidatus Woesearchaeota archaeon]
MKELIDEKDWKILEILKENSNLSTYKISKKTLIPVTTVNNRIKKLKKTGVIKKFTVEVDKNKLGFNLTAYILISLSLRELKEEKMNVRDLVRIIKKNPDIESVDNVTGDFDIILKIHARDINDVNDYVVNTLAGLKGVEKTKTALILTKD